MLRCQSGPNSDTQPFSTIRLASVASNIRVRPAAYEAYDKPSTSGRVKFDREQQDNKETEPSTSQQRHSSRTSVVTQPLAVMWKRGPNTKPLDASDTRADVQRY